MDVFRPEFIVLIKLGSIAVHAEELISPGGHPFDAEAIKSLLGDAEVIAWLAEMDKLAFLPKKRSDPVVEPVAKITRKQKKGR